MYAWQLVPCTFSQNKYVQSANNTHARTHAHRVPATHSAPYVFVMSSKLQRRKRRVRMYCVPIRPAAFVRLRSRRPRILRIHRIQLMKTWRAHFGRPAAPSGRFAFGRVLSDLRCRLVLTLKPKRPFRKVLHCHPCACTPVGIVHTHAHTNYKYVCMWHG